MYNEQDNNYNAGGNYSGGYQGYNYGERRTYDYYETPRPKKKKRVGKVIAIILAACVVIGGSAVGGFYIGNNFLSEKVSGTAIEEVAPEPIKEVTLQEPQVSESGIESTQTVTAVVTDVTNVVEEVMPSVVSISRRIW